MPPIDLDHLDRKASGRTLIMGVINVTPDSFSDGGDHLDAGDAIRHGRQLAAEGADIIDIGGESTRPGASEVDAATELRRALPVIAGLAGPSAPLLSIDTYKAAVAEAALRSGASIVNDVRGLQREPEIAHVAAAHGAAVIAGHWEPEARYDKATILPAMLRYFDASIAIARRAGLADHRIVLDPGIGFGKGEAENLLILDRLEALTALGFPVLVGASRKRFIGAITGRAPKERLAGTLAANVLAAERGASLVRVHDVTAHRDALAVTQAILSSRPVPGVDAP